MYVRKRDPLILKGNQTILTLIATGISCIILNTHLTAQPEHFRPPAIPLVTCNPYFSIWSFADHPATDWPRHWTGAVHALCSVVRIDGQSFRILGKAPQNIPVMTLKTLSVLPTRTIYEFVDGGISLTLTFMTPLLLHDLNIASRPVTYVSWEVTSLDGNKHAVSIYFDNSAELVVNTPDQQVAWSRVLVEGCDVLRIGSHDQPILEKSGDDLRIDWGYFYLVSPKQQNATSVITGHDKSRSAFVARGSLPSSDDLRMPRAARDDWPVLVYAFDLGKVSSKPVERFVVMAYDEIFSIEYFHRRLPPFWRSAGLTLEDLLRRSVQEYTSLMSQCKKFDEELMNDLRKVGGERYAQVAALAYRQALAAHTLVADIDGTPLLFPKENFSNGCIATVDVIYPTSPIFLLFNVELLKASVTPILQYSQTTQWKFPFAPHDLGTYPFANGQVYGGGETSEENQMPVEECGNLLLLVDAIAFVEGKTGFASRYWTSLEKWAGYLKEKGLDPENQLCTDDFAGHLAHNVNLSLKAILALGAYSRLCWMVGKKVEAEEYGQTAKQYALQWEKMANDGDHYRLAFDKPASWSQKYNLVWDRLLDLNVFSKEVARREIEFYKTKQNRFGLPLDNRKDYTKLDWVLWSATLADERSDFEELVSRVYDFANETPNRVPLTDWYDTVTGKQVGFQARSVVGGVFIKMLSESPIWKKWSSRGKR